MPSPKELAKALARQDSVTKQPRNRFFGAVADAAGYLSDQADRYVVPERDPLFGGMRGGDLLPLRNVNRLLDDLSYGGRITTGRGQTTTLRPEVVDTVALGGAMMPAAKGLSKAALREGARQIETGTGIGRAALDPRMRAVPEGASMPQRPKTEFEILHDTAQRNAALPVEQGGLGLPANNTYIDRANVMYPTDAYHGGNSLIKEADYKYSGKGKDQYGSAALYTGSDPSIANSYVKQGESGGNIMPLRINREGHVEHDKAGNLTSSQIKKLIQSSPDEYALSNFGDVEYEGANKVLGNAVNSYKDVGDGELLTQMNMINNDFYTGHPQKFNEKISELTGIKGLNVDVGGGNQLYLSYKPENIRSRFAAFDPMRRHEADILAGVGVGGMLDPQAIAEALRQQDRK
jgi:hypothetical protein